jgi:hypothetical protein
MFLHRKEREPSKSRGSDRMAWAEARKKMITGRQCWGRMTSSILSYLEESVTVKWARRRTITRVGLLDEPVR